MGEKGNITSSELAGGAGAVVAGAGTQVTAVFQDAGEALKDKVIDKGLDAGIVGAQEKYRDRQGSKDVPENPSTT
jgi:hypothetical protein